MWLVWSILTLICHDVFQSRWDEYIRNTWAKWDSSHLLWSLQSSWCLTRQQSEANMSHTIITESFCLWSQGDTTPPCPQTSGCVKIVNEQLRPRCMVPLAHWLQHHLQGTKVMLIHREPVRKSHTFSREWENSLKLPNGSNKTHSYIWRGNNSSSWNSSRQ